MALCTAQIGCVLCKNTNPSDNLIEGIIISKEFERGYAFTLVGMSAKFLGIFIVGQFLDAGVTSP